MQEARGIDKKKGFKCENGHRLRWRFTPKKRNLHDGTNLACDICKNSIPDITDGYATCDANCDYDACRNCYKFHNELDSD